jgi:hypothetical protein
MNIALILRHLGILVLQYIYDISDALTGDYEEEIKSSTYHPVYSDD